jgi:outer membrane lipoprotein-sorting protein
MTTARLTNCRLLMLAAAAWLLYMATFGAAAAQAADDLDAVMHLLAARRHGEVSFVDQHFLSVMELIYDAPNRLEKRTLEPHPETLVLAGDVVTVQRGRSRHVLELKSYPQIIPLIESIRATLAGDRAALERVFRLEFMGDVERWTLVLVPLDAAVAKTVARVQIDGYRDVLLKVEIRQTNGDRSLMTMRPPAQP